METVRKSLTITLIALLCTLLLNVHIVMAETETKTVPDVTTQTTDPTQILDENGQPVDPGILPDSPFYWWDQLMKQIQLALAWTPERQAIVLQEQALENIAEAVTMTEEGQPEDAEIAMNKYLETVEEVKSLIETLSDTSCEEAQNLLAAISSKNASNIQVLGNLILSEKLPPQASEKIFINAVKKITMCMDKLENKTQIQLKKDLRGITEELDDVDLDEETETVLEDLKDPDQTDQDSQTDETNSDTDTNDDVTNDTDGTVVDQEIVKDQNTNSGQTKKEQKEEKNNNIENDVNEDGRSDEIQNENNNGSGKNHAGGKDKKNYKLNFKDRPNNIGRSGFIMRKICL